VPAPLAAWVAKKGTEAAVEAGASLARRVVPKVAGFLVGIVLLGVMGVGIGGVPQAAACGPGTAVPSSADLDPAILARINTLKPDYEQAAASTGVSWALLAGVDFREDGNHGPGQDGPDDPGASALSGEPIGTANPDGGGTMHSKAESLVAAGNHLKEMASGVYGVTLTAASAGDDIKAALVAYNRGYSYKQDGAAPDSSPYVMNQYDDAHRNMVFPSIAGETLAGMTDTRPGGFTVFSRLGGASTSPTGCAGLSDSNIVAIAQQQLGLAEQPKGCNCGPEISKFLGSAATALPDDQRQWCAMFVSWVYMTAGHPFTGGTDGGWNIWGVVGLRQWLISNGEWHDRGSGDIPQPGDVVTFAGDGHTGLVEKTDGTTLDTIEGNTSDEVARRSYANYDTDGEIVGWGRQRGTAGAGIALGSEIPTAQAA